MTIRETKPWNLEQFLDSKFRQVNGGRADGKRSRCFANGHSLHDVQMVDLVVGGID